MLKVTMLSVDSSLARSSISVRLSAMGESRQFHSNSNGIWYGYNQNTQDEDDVPR
ncbi:hypothetical protein RDWZM_000283 [Blomia tropicalis]|uniref:Uncharacterized protein n=1 Tax=Blomia tropicalis TaxID=40697 RepID=A0A9Q0RMU5_BLOTA|nr:hypothetical protein RDWZM_000283 [Blomia tropicalis]